MTEWNEFSVWINREAANAVSNILLDLGSSGLSINDRQDFANLPEYGFDGLWALDESKFPEGQVVIKGYFHQEDRLDRLKQEIKDRVDKLKDFDLEVENYQVHYAQVNDEDWADTWKKYYHPVAISHFITIVPKWEDYQAQDGREITISLDPGLAFGTGTHQTTQLSLQLLEQCVRKGQTVVDVGTGSGVLSIASAYMQAGQVYAYDLDDIAVASAKSNIALNGFQNTISVQAGDLLQGVDLEADLVVANILAEIIEPLIPQAMRVLKENGKFISSGIIKEKKDHIIQCLEAGGFVVDQVNQMDDWVAILARKPFADPGQDD